MSLPELEELKTHIEEFADVVASKVIEKLSPASDLVSKRALYREFGRSWVDKHIAPNGKIEGKRFGTGKNSTIKYSRVECTALLKAEKLKTAELTAKYGRMDQR